MAVTTHEEIRVGEMVIRFLLEGEESGGSVAVFEFDVPVGAKVAAAHSHDGYDETIYGLEGTLTWTISGQQVDVASGEAVVAMAETARDKLCAIVTGIVAEEFVAQ